MINEMDQGLIKSAATMAKDVGVSTSTAYRDAQKIRRVMDESCSEEETEKVHHSVFKKVIFRRSTESPPTFDGETLRQYEKRTETEPLVVELQEHSLAPQAIEFLRKSVQGSSRKQVQKPLAQFNFVMRKLGGSSNLTLTDLCLKAKAKPGTKELTRYSSPEMLKIVMPKGESDRSHNQDLPLICEAPIVWNSSHWGKGTAKFFTIQPESSVAFCPKTASCQ
jgi:hypothetical protein